MQAIKRALWTLTRPPASHRAVVIGSALLAFVLFLTTLQLDINGSRHPYTTDVGEIQNALPRWGIIHFNGYPLYSILGSSFVTLLRWVGIPPALGASLFSALWGAVAVGLLAALALILNVPTLLAGGIALLLALSTSFWVDASIAEVHTMSVALMLGTLIAALRFGREGRRADLLWLAALGGQLVAHQPAFALFLPALAVLILPQWDKLIGPLRGALPAAVGLALLGPLTYLYLPIRVWQGADWTFGTPDTWQGFRHLALDNKSYVLRLPQTAAAWLERGRRTLDLLGDDLPLPMLIPGLLGLLWVLHQGRPLEVLGLCLAWIPYAALSTVIWEGRLSDALLAVKLPVIVMAALGLGVLIGEGVRRWNWFVPMAIAVWPVAAGVMYSDGRPQVLEITRAPGAEAIIAIAAQIEPAADGKPIVLTALWGNDYWTLAYAQAYRDDLSAFRLVEHDSDFEAILDRGEHLVTLSHTFYAWSTDRWRKRLGDLYLSSYAPNVIEMRDRPIYQEEDIPPGLSLTLDNGIAIRHASLSWRTPDTLLLTVYWQAEQDLEQDYSIAVHLVSQDPPTGPQDILRMADRDHPVSGWYPVSQWRPGEIVLDHYPLQVPEGTAPLAVRLSMYQALGDGQFRNTEWLSVPVPPRP